MRQIIFIGPQGSGKGTQAKIVSKKLGLCHISTGDLLRNTKGNLSEKISKLIDKGQMVPDDLILTLLQQRLSHADCREGYILDGYPRNLKQAETLEKLIGIGTIIEIHISDDESVKRLSGRRNCPECGAIYNIYTTPKPKDDNVCDICHINLYQRKDDTEQAIRSRLSDYHLLTEPILNRYRGIKINGEQPIEKVAKEIIKVLEH